MWAIAVHDLCLSTEQFYGLTPRQFHLLAEAHRRHLSHMEMLPAYTTAAVINYSLGAPDEPVQPTRFMPHWRQPKSAPSVTHRRYTEDEVIDWQARVAQLAAEMKQGHGAMLDEIRKQSDAG